MSFQRIDLASTMRDVVFLSVIHSLIFTVHNSLTGSCADCIKMSHLTSGRQNLYLTVSFIEPTKDMLAEGTLSSIFILFEKV